MFKWTWIPDEPEQVEPWEVIDTPIAGQDLSEDTGSKGQIAHKETDRRDEDPINEAGTCVQTSNMRYQSKNSAHPDELYPCKACHGYHYSKTCIYLLSWTAWLEYHGTYMPSHPFPESEEFNLGDLDSLKQRAKNLDESPNVRTPNYISNTRLKADLMTPSSRNMYWEDERWEKTRSQRERREMHFGNDGAMWTDPPYVPPSGQQASPEHRFVRAERIQAGKVQHIWQRRRNMQPAVPDFLVEEGNDEEDSFATLRAD